MTTTTYIVLPFTVAKRGGKLVPGTSQKFKEREKALRAAERMAGQHAGIAVLEEQSDAEQDIYAEPKLLKTIGRVPEEMVDALAA